MSKEKPKGYPDEKFVHSPRTEIVEFVPLRLYKLPRHPYYSFQVRDPRQEARRRLSTLSGRKVSGPY
jgi:hypothetical protein